MSSGGKGGGSQEPYVVGYEYGLGIHFGVCHGPVDGVQRIDIDEEPRFTAAPASPDGQLGEIQIVGGDTEDEATGVTGTATLYDGGLTQDRDPYLVSQLGQLISAFRGILTCVAQVSVGRVPYLQPWRFRVQRIKVRAYDGRPQWYVEKAQINTKDMNGVHIIRECLTDVSWGIGSPESDIDDTTFRAAADTIYTEGLGLSFLWLRQVSIYDFIADVLAHIDASLYVDRTTGKFVIKLIRDDYDIETIPVLNESTVFTVTNYTRQTIGDLENAVTVKYWDSETGNDASLTVQDIALVAQQGAVIATTRQYKGAASGTVATKLASRDLRVSATPLILGTVICTRQVASAFNIGDPFLLSWDNYDLEETVMRVTNIKFGTPKNNKISIDFVQDVFRESEALYAIPPSTGWVDPISQPKYCPYRALETAPYYRLARILGDAEAQALDPTDAFMMCAGVKPSNDALNYSLYTSPTISGYTYKGSKPFAPTGIINSTLQKSGSSIVITGDGLGSLTIGSWIQIGAGATAEIVEITGISGNTFSIGRGCIDTVPQKHANKTRIWGFDRFAGTDGETHSDSESLYVKMLPKTAKGTLDILDAPADTITFSNRQYLPYPPGKFQINGEYWPADITGDMVITWTHRDRLQQTAANIVDFTEDSIGPEAGTTYNLTVYNDTTTTSVHSETGITGATKTVTKTWAEDDQLTVTLESQRDGEVSYQKHTHVINAPETIGLVEVNGTYWDIDGETKLLVGGTWGGEPHLYEQQYSGNGITLSDDTDLLGTELTKIADAGGNYFRCTLVNWSGSYVGNGDQTVYDSVFPFSGSAGNFDLTTISTAWIDRVDALLYRAEALGIIVQLELFDTWWCVKNEWTSSLMWWNPTNVSSPANYLHGNYPTNTGLPVSQDTDNDTFTAPALAAADTCPLLIAQKLYVAAVCTIVKRHGNALLQIQNESEEVDAWENYWADYIAAQSVTAPITSMKIDNGNHSMTDSRYDFGDNSQQQSTASNLDTEWTELLAFHSSGTKPVNAVKVYSRWNGVWGYIDIAVDLYFMYFMGGNAACAFHPGTGNTTTDSADGSAGLGTSSKALKSMTAGRWLDNNCDLSSMTPIPLLDSKWNSSRPTSGAWACGSANHIAIYINSGTTFTFNTSQLGSNMTVRWISADDNATSGSGSISTSSAFTINNPFVSDRAIVIMARV